MILIQGVKEMKRVFIFKKALLTEAEERRHDVLP